MATPSEADGAITDWLEQEVDQQLLDEVYQLATKPTLEKHHR